MATLSSGNTLFKHYHRITGYDRHAMTSHSLDWAFQPSPYKTYPDSEDGFDLGDLPVMADTNLGSVLSDAVLGRQPGVSPDRDRLSAICFLANGLTGRAVHGNAQFYYRSSPSAGALYPNELYLAWFGSGDIDPGVYHVGIHNRRLTRLRVQNPISFFPSTEPECFRNLWGVFLISGIFYRSAWKYRNRAYRYLLLDGGHLLESTRLALTSKGFPAPIWYDFDDLVLNRLIGVDETREGSLALIGIGGKNMAVPAPLAVELNGLPETIIQRSQVSEREVVYKDIREIHEKSSHDQTFSSGPPPMIGAAHLGLVTGPAHPIKTSPEKINDPFRMTYSEAVIRRRSKRNFLPHPLSFSQFSALLETICHASCPAAGHEYPSAASGTVQTGLLVQHVEGLSPGFYLIDPLRRTFSLSAPSSGLTSQMASACLNQEWLCNAALHVLFMTNLEIIDAHWGARGYRYAMMTAGRLGHGVYLAGTAMGLGCCGIGAFYDSEVESLLGLNHAATLLYLLAVGRPQ